MSDRATRRMLIKAMQVWWRERYDFELTEQEAEARIRAQEARQRVMAELAAIVAAHKTR
jgi:hypothetical protein